MLESTFHYLANSKAVLDKMGGSLPELDLVNTILQLQQSYTSVSLLHFHAAELLQLFTLFQAAPIACRQADYRPLAHHESTFIDRRIMYQRDLRATISLCLLSLLSLLLLTFLLSGCIHKVGS